MTDNCSDCIKESCFDVRAVCQTVKAAVSYNHWVTCSRFISGRSKGNIQKKSQVFTVALVCVSQEFPLVSALELLVRANITVKSTIKHLVLKNAAAQVISKIVYPLKKCEEILFNKGTLQSCTKLFFFFLNFFKSNHLSYQAHLAVAWLTDRFIS